MAAVSNRQRIHLERTFGQTQSVAREASIVKIFVTFRRGDELRLLKIYSHYVANTAITFECTVPPVEEFQSRIARTLENFPYLVAEHDEKIIGFAYAGNFGGREAYKFSAELTIYLDKNFRGRGVGRKLYRKLEKLLAQRGTTNLYACVAYPEIEDEFLSRASLKFHERPGFNVCGKFTNCGEKFNRRYSMVYMEKFLQ